MRRRVLGATGATAYGRSFRSGASDPELGGQGYAVCLDDGTVVGHAEQFEEPLIDAINAAEAGAVS